MDVIQEDENKIRLHKNAFSFLEIDESVFFHGR